MPLSTADLAALSRDDHGEDTEGLFVMADLESAPPRSASQVTPQPPSAVAEWPELDADLVERRPRSRSGLKLGLVAGGVLAAAALMLFNGPLRTKVGSLAGHAPAAPAPMPAAPAAPAPTPAAPATAPTAPAVVAARSSQVAISISSDPPGATVYDADGKRSLGVTPLVLSLPRGTEPVLFRVSKPGHVEGQLRLVPDSDRPAVVSLAQSNSNSSSHSRRRGPRAEGTEKVRNAVPLDPFAP